MFYSELRFHVKCDPHPEVRKVVLQSLDVAQNLDCVLEKVNDVSDGVRSLAFKTIGDKVDIESISIEIRERIIFSGLTDSSGENRLGFHTRIAFIRRIIHL